ncbi:hypothetical protein ACFLU6_12260, partial [Acidobacteriota bacterium]
MKKLSGACILVFLFVLVPYASAQWQSCVYCDVEALNPDPFPVNPCDTMTIIINGDGYMETGTNGCDVIPTVDVRSRRPDRILILAYRVLDDNTIEVDIEVPCDATPGIVGIDVLIDDNTGDSIPAYACGNLRMEVLPPDGCDYCEVISTNPITIDAEPCETTTVTITGEGFLDTDVNGCVYTPVITVVGRPSGRITILGFRVIDDNTIEVDIEIPCDATPGDAWIDIIIDDITTDNIDALECGNAHVNVVDYGCVFCEVTSPTPTTIPVNPCDTGTIVIDGSGFLDTGINDCPVTPIVDIRSLNPLRLIILGFRVLDDGTIEVDYEVPCDASPGNARIVITIDDDPNDTVDAIECGRVRFEIVEEPGCDYCEISFPDTTAISVDPCDTGTITVSGQGFLDPAVNDCLVEPEVVV